jgi:nicotinate-nucleotide pyrophosphorylase (carboxylating)
MFPFDLAAVDDLVRNALAEDLGRGDLTTQLTVDPGVRATAQIIAKQGGIVAGLPLIERVFAALGSIDTRVDALLSDGAGFSAGDVIVRLAGPAADLLSGERVALNFLQHLSGVATLTRRFVDAVAGTKARIVDTRKTTPGLRLLEKYAVRVGGGHNHRLGLDDGVLIKDNHITAAGGVVAAVTRARANAPHTVKIEVECASMAQVDEALQAAADVILLDNMSTVEMTDAVCRIAGRAVVEASGGVTLEQVRAVAQTGVDLISIGVLTHSAPAVDLSMRVAVASQEGG